MNYLISRTTQHDKIHFENNSFVEEMEKGRGNSEELLSNEGSALFYFWPNYNLIVRLLAFGLSLKKLKHFQFTSRNPS